MANKRINKAYVRYDGTGRVIPGSLILNRFKPKVGNWQETPAYLCCNPSTLALRLLFNDIANAPVGDATSVSDWNTFFNLPTKGNPFTSVVIVGNEVQLFGGSDITLKEGLMNDAAGGDSLISVIDDANCIVASEGYPFYSEISLTTIILPALTIITGSEFCYECFSLSDLQLNSLITIDGTYSFDGNILTSINLPLLQTFGGYTFSNSESVTEISLPSCTSLGGTVGNNGVFNSIIGNNVTLTVPSALMTCNSGNPDGDIEFLQANNTVTVVTV